MMFSIFYVDVSLSLSLYGLLVLTGTGNIIDFFIILVIDFKLDWIAQQSNNFPKIKLPSILCLIPTFACLWYFYRVSNNDTGNCMYNTFKDEDVCKGTMFKLIFELT